MKRAVNSKNPNFCNSLPDFTWLSQWIEPQSVNRNMLGSRLQFPILRSIVTHEIGDSRQTVTIDHPVQRGLLDTRIYRYVHEYQWV